MKVIYNKIIPFKSFRALMLFGVIFARKEYKPLPDITINHERIHKMQAKKAGGFLIFYIKYLYYSIKYGYKKNPYEIEAYDNEHDFEYKP